MLPHRGHSFNPFDFSGNHTKLRASEAGFQVAAGEHWLFGTLHPSLCTPKGSMHAPRPDMHGKGFVASFAASH